LCTNFGKPRAPARRTVPAHLSPHNAAENWVTSDTRLAEPKRADARPAFALRATARQPSLATRTKAGNGILTVSGCDPCQDSPASTILLCRSPTNHPKAPHDLRRSSAIPSVRCRCCLTFKPSSES